MNENEIQLSAVCRIHPGKLAAFREAAATCLDAVRRSDRGTLQYDWFLNEARNLCIVRERYVDSSAVLEHVTNLGDALVDLLALCEARLEVCGTPSPELSEALAGWDHIVLERMQGLEPTSEHR